MEIRTEMADGLVILTIDEDVIRCNSAHYIHGHEKCGCIHGHTYFIENLVIRADYNILRQLPGPGYLDFGMLKKLIKDLYDHNFIVPEAHANFWRGVYLQAIEAGIPMRFNVVGIPYDIATCENMADYLKKKLLEIQGVVGVSFEMREGPSQGVII
jgi:6-pyruvoyl-tetrahydropterin synthase